MQRKSSFPVEKFQEYLTPCFKDIRTGKKKSKQKSKGNNTKCIQQFCSFKSFHGEFEIIGNMVGTVREAKQSKPNPQSMEIGNTHVQVEISKPTRKKKDLIQVKLTVSSILIPLYG